MLVASPPGGPSQPVRGACHWLDDQRAEQGGDLVAGERDLVIWRRGAGVFGGGGDGQDLYGHLVPEASGRARDALDRAFGEARMCPGSAPATS